METKEFFILDGDEQKGPILFNDFIIMNLPDDTLVWYDELEDWKKIKEIEELKSIIKPKKTPPPPPKLHKESTQYTQISGNLKIDSTKKDSVITVSVKKSPEIYIFLISWIAIHLFALLMSYSGIDFFSWDSSPEKDRFWPFVEFFSDVKVYEPSTSFFNPRSYNIEKSFNGIFFQYDWTEFIFYIGSSLIGFVIIKLSQIKKK